MNAPLQEHRPARIRWSLGEEDGLGFSPWHDLSPAEEPAPDHPERTFLGMAWGCALTALFALGFFLAMAGLAAITPDRW